MTLGSNINGNPRGTGSLPRLGTGPLAAPRQAPAAPSAPPAAPAAAPTGPIASVERSLEATSRVDAESALDRALAAVPPPPTLRPGASGPAVTRLQTLLQTQGYLAQAPNGTYDAATEAAVRHVQRNMHHASIDGIAGPRTWNALSSMPAPSVRSALAEAESYFLPQGDGAPSAKEGATTRTVDRNGLDANVVPDSNPEAHRQIRRNMPVVEARMAELTRQGQWTPAQRDQYNAVTAGVSHDPAAVLSMQTLLLSGRLPGDRPNADGQNLLGALSQWNDPATALHPSINRGELMSQLVREVATPSSINQDARGTCAGTTMQIYMAMRDPAELVRLTGGLASPGGAVTMRNGQALTRAAGTEAASPLQQERDDGAGNITLSEIPDVRSIPTRLFSAAALEYGNGTETYDNYTDYHSNGGAGLDGAQTQTTFEALSGRNAVRMDVENNGSTYEEALARLRQVTAAGTPVPAGMRWGILGPTGSSDGAHEILVTRVDDQRVHYHNPWGQEESMDLSEFRSRMLDILVPPLPPGPPAP